MVAPLTPADEALLDADPQLVRRIEAGQYRLAFVRPAPGEPAERSFVTAGGHPVGWHRRQRLAQLFERGLVYAGEDLQVSLNRRSLSRPRTR